MIEIISIEPGKDDDLGELWLCKLRVDRLEIEHYIPLRKAKTRQEAEAWLSGHYEDLSDLALHIHAASADEFLTVGEINLIRQLYRSQA